MRFLSHNESNNDNVPKISMIIKHAILHTKNLLEFYQFCINRVKKNTI